MVNPASISETTTKRLIATALCVLSLSATATAKPSEGKIDLRPSLEVQMGDDAWYRLSFHYEFPGRPAVRIGGVGVVAPSGDLSFVAPEPRVRAFDVETGALLATEEAIDPTRLMGNSLFDYPAIGAYSDTYTIGRWQGASGFVDHLFDTLSLLFPGGYRAYGERGEHFVATSYATLAGTPERTTAQVSILVAHPGEVAPATFRVHVAARERRSHSAWRDTLSAPVEALVLDAVGQLVATLQTPGTETSP